jgi:hypothetical protein
VSQHPLRDQAVLASQWPGAATASAIFRLDGQPLQPPPNHRGFFTSAPLPWLALLNKQHSRITRFQDARGSETEIILDIIGEQGFELDLEFPNAAQEQWRYHLHQYLLPHHQR